MRLTLRTLLAYLDKTLSAKDAEAIGEKIKESSFASQMVDRVRSALSNGQLAAPSPAANGPTDDPNVVGEYLDSTLSAEQAAEVDRTLLESDVHLAEAAACHQVLTMVLGTRADVPADLRKRVYGLGRRGDDKADGVAGPSDSTVVRPAVAPVGLDDSGAYRAASRMEQSGAAEGEKAKGSGTSGSASASSLAGSRPLSAQEADEIFGSRIRASRIVPWLVTLALAAAFLFVLAQAFRPLITRDPMALDSEPADEPTTTPLLPGADGAEDQEAASEEEPAAKPPGDVDNAGESSSPAPDTSDEEATEPQPDDEEATPQPPGEPPADEESEASDPAAASEPDATVAMADRDRPDTSDDEPMTDDTATPAATESEGDEATEQEAVRLASDEGLLLVSGKPGDSWERVSAGDEIPLGQTLVCPPLFRLRVSVGETAELVLVGPARLQISGTLTEPRLVLDRGRVVVATQSESLVVDLQLGDASGLLGLPELGDMAALEVSHFRVPGTDPTNPENSSTIRKLEAVVGRLSWSPGESESIPIETGQRWTQIGGGDPQVLVPTEPADWVDPPAGNRQTLDTAAREGLLAFLDVDKSLALALREAVGFRRAEVAALAAQTLLLMGESDIYFGSEGVLSQESQKSYWSEHVNAIQATLNEGPKAAAAVKQAAVAMDGASSDALFRMLWGYSPEQLKAGADAFLVETLDSPQMELRVLAIENLRQITGTSLYYKPEQENASRRSSEVKKWETRLRRGDIRWETIPLPD